jgi:hypothetical protein
MTTNSIKTIFGNDIYRRIEEVIKVDQTDDQVLSEELDEYVITRAIQNHYTNIFEAYSEAPNKPTEGVAIWISGFFGSGKSSFAKFLGLSIADRMIDGVPAAGRFASRTSDNKLRVLLKSITEKTPTHAVIFDVSTDRGIRSGNQTLTEIIYGLFLQSLGYAKDLDLSELEISLEEQGKLAEFEAEYRRLFGKEWSLEKGKVVFALNEASTVLHELDPSTYPMADSWVKAVKNKADITPGKLAERATELMRRRRPGHSLLFVVDEVGQFVARDVQKMLDLQAVVQNLGVKGRGKHWIAVTSQERLDELVSGLDNTKIELARLMDRFPLQVHLEPSDISEVTSRRVLAKSAAAQADLGKLFDEHRGKLTENTRLTADIKLPELTRDRFVDLYPLLPYQVDLMIQVVSGLRTRGGGSKHVGGANRTIIKLAQQVLINPAVNLAEQSLGVLARLDHVYDLVEGNIGSEIRAKILAIPNEVSHPLAHAVAKAICLLQYVQSVHCTAENIAAVLHPSISSESQLASVKEALQELEAAHKIRLGQDGYRIPTPAEDDWERIRNGINPRPGETHTIYNEMLSAFWQPQPAHALLETKTFKAGLALRGREIAPGDIVFDVSIADDGETPESLAANLRTRSQQERKTVFWAVSPTEAIDREIVQLFRSKEMLRQKERGARTPDESSLITEEKIRRAEHQDRLRGLLRSALLSGNVYFRGNDRSPGDPTVDVGKSAAEILGQVLPEVFDRFREAAARPNEVKKGIEALFGAENLQGLPLVFVSLGLLRDENGKMVFCVEKGPLAEVLVRIEDRANYGETSSGRSLTDEFGKEPFGWDFDAVRLFVLSLLRAGKIEATSRGQTIDSVASIEAREVFTNNNLFRQVSLRPKKGLEFKELIKAAEAFRDTFGAEIGDVSSARPISDAIKKEVERHEDTVGLALALLQRNQLPGTAALEAPLGEMKAIARGNESNSISAFNASHRQIKDAIRRAGELGEALNEVTLHVLQHAGRTLRRDWAFLINEEDVVDNLRTRAGALQDLVARETFYRELAEIEQHARAIENEYNRRHAEALKSRIAAYSEALDRLTKSQGWSDLSAEAQHKLAAPLEKYAKPDGEAAPIPQLRSDLLACDARLRDAMAELHRIIDGDRIVAIDIGTYFDGGLESEEQLDAALEGIREECAHLIGAGKKVVLR